MTIEVDKVLFTDGSELGSSDRLLTAETFVQLVNASGIADGASYTPQSEHDTLKESVSRLIEYVSAQQRAALVVTRSLVIPLSFSYMSFNQRALTFMLYHSYTPEEMLDLDIIKDGYMRIKAPADGPSNYNVFQRDTDFNYGSYRIVQVTPGTIALIAGKVMETPEPGN